MSSMLRLGVPWIIFDYTKIVISILLLALLGFTSLDFLGVYFNIWKDWTCFKMKELSLNFRLHSFFIKNKLNKNIEAEIARKIRTM